MHFLFFLFKSVQTCKQLCCVMPIQVSLLMVIELVHGHVHQTLIRHVLHSKMACRHILECVI